MKDTATGRVEITSQNHNFAVDPASVAARGWEPTHRNLTRHVRGVRHREWPVFSVHTIRGVTGTHDATTSSRVHESHADAREERDRQMPKY